MQLFNFEDLDQKHRELIMKNLRFYYFMVAVVYAIYIAKFIIKYKYHSYISLYIFLYAATLMIYPLVKKITGNTFKALWAFNLAMVLTLDVLLFMAGGIRAPGTMWLSLFPFFGASILGVRGFQWGIVFVSVTFATLFLLKYNGIEMYPFTSIESFQFEFQANLALFTFVSFYYTYFYVRSESVFQNRIQTERDKNENLLRILFHDLANPMQTIRMLVKKAQNHKETIDPDKFLGQIDRTSYRIVEILDHVRQMKAIEDGKVNLNLKPENLSELIFKVRDIFDDRLKEKQLELVVDMDSPTQTTILVDSIYFTNQVLANVISNAIKFSHNGSKILISWRIDDHFLHLKIQDEGIGMPAELMKTVFEQNVSCSRRGTAGELGTGYGMPLVKTFVEQFHGAIAMESLEKTGDSKPHGTTITITLPIYN